MTARSSPTALQRADEMRVRILRNPEAWRVLSQHRARTRRDYDPAEFRSDRDDYQAPLEERDPRCIEFELDELRRAFWNLHDAPRVRLVARHAVRLDRHLDTRDKSALVA